MLRQPASSHFNILSLTHIPSCILGLPLGEVTDSFGRVRGYKRLYVIDSSLLPGGAAGVSPALLVTGMWVYVFVFVFFVCACMLM